MSSSSYEFPYAWLAVLIVITILQIAVAVLLFRERDFSTWTMLIASVLSGTFALVSGLIFPLSQLGLVDFTFEACLQHYTQFGRFSEFSELLFFVGLALYAFRRRALSARIAELEQIIAAQNSRLQ